eukprot:gene1271-1387_t
MQKLVLLITILLLMTISWAFQFPQQRAIQNRLSSRLQVKDEPIPENETEEETMARLRRKARSRMYNEKGVPFAPWMVKQIDEDTMVRLLYEDEKGLRKSKKPRTTLDRGEIESSEGLRYRMAGNQVELGWATNGEADNRGFVVEKRPSYGGDWMEVASFNEVSQLQTKGPQGGRYRYTDPSTSGGSWIYRIKDVDSSGNINVLCQSFVEVQTAQESKSQLVAGIALVAVLGGLLAVGASLDPIQ